MTGTATITPAEFEQALKRACVRSIARAVRYDPLRGGDQTAVQFGALLPEIEDEAELSTSQTRRQLRALQAAGKVIRDDRRGGSTAWWLVGLADELRGPASCGPVRTMPTDAAAPAAHLKRQGVTNLSRAPWWEVLGVARDDSFRECTRAFRLESARLMESEDPDAPQALARLKAAYSECCRDHDVQVEQ